MSRPCLVLLALLQITPQVSQQPAPSGEIRGRVTDKETGQPLPRARVDLHKRDGGERWSTRTDEAGRYRFAELPAGEYSGIVQPGRSRPTHSVGFLSAGPRGPIALQDGETREIDVALPRTYAIEVRVVDEWGDPLSGVGVSAQAVESTGPVQTFWPMSTDDHGRLRVFGLSQGRYIVCADSSIAGVSLGARGDALLRTCHPSATDERGAQVVRVDRSDVGEVEIRMRRGRTVTIAGRVVDTSAAPATRARLMLSQFGPGSSSGLSHEIDSEGNFRILNVLPGEYAIEAWIGGPDQPEERRPLERAFVPVRVDSTDVSDLVVTLQKTVNVVGRVTIEDPTASFGDTRSYAAIAVMSHLADDTGPGWGSMVHAPVDDDRTFTLRSMYGHRTLDVMNLPRGWYVRSIYYAGKEIIDEPTTFKDSGEPTIEVMLSNRGAVVIGRATDQAGNAVGGAKVLMFPADRARASRHLPTEARASTSGDFRAGPVRAGEYCIVALPPSAPSVQPGDSARLSRLAALADRISLGDLEERTVDVRVVAER